MSTQYGGRPALVENNLPAAKNISSTTNATPVVITTSTAHGIKTGDYFVVHGADETGLNDVALVAGTVTSTTITALVAPAGTDTVGSLSGGAHGTVQSLGFGTTYAIPSDGPGNPRNAASVNVALEALGDRTSWLIYALQFALAVVRSGKLSIKAGGILEVESDALLQVDSGAGFTIANQTDILSGGKIRALSGAQIQVLAGGQEVNASVLGTQYTGSQPAKTADPGAANIGIATNQIKAWGDVTIGNNAFVTNDGMNIASIAIDGGNKAKVTFARAMANTDYAIVFGGSSHAAIPVAEKADKTTTYFKIAMIDTSTFSATPISLGAATTAWDLCFMVLGRQ